jgi:two-component system OmpR family sensor kinase
VIRLSRARHDPRLDARDQALLRAAARRIALQSAAVLAVAVAVAVVGLAVTFDRAQHGEIRRTVHAAAMNADDVGDPPPGVLLVESSDGRVRLTPGSPPGLADLATLPTGAGSATVDGRHFETYAATHEGVRFVAAYDLAGHHREEVRLLWTSVIAGLLGIVLAAVVGLLIGQRAVRPMASALTLQRRFVTDASHELRTPLTVLHTRAQLIRRRLAAAAPPEQLAELDQLVADTSALGEVVSDLLLSAQLHNDRVTGSPVDLQALSTEVVRSLRPYAESSGTTLVTELAPGSWTVLGASAALRRALGALVDNAISHAPGGRVVVGVDGDDDWVRVRVTDDGEGFRAEDRAVLTDRFSRGAAAAGQRRFGLGLSLVDEVVRAHRGRLDLAGTVGEGAEVTMVLPRT